MKFIRLRFFCTITLVFILVCNMAGIALADNRIHLVVWSFTNELQSMIERYYEPNHPEIVFHYQIFPTDGDAYTTRLDNMFANYAASDEAPDVFTLEWNFVKHYVNSNATGSLSDVGLTDSEMSVSFPSSALVGQDLGGVQKGLSWQSTPGVLFYRASLAQKYLGVKTPEEMQQKVNSWEAFLQTAEELKVNSEGACKMVTGTADVWQAYKYYRSQGWVADDIQINSCDFLIGGNQASHYWADHIYHDQRDSQCAFCWFRMNWLGYQKQYYL